MDIEILAFLIADAVLAICAIVGLALNYSRDKKGDKISEMMLQQMGTLREDIRDNRRRIDEYAKSGAAGGGESKKAIALREKELELERQKHEWNQLVNIAQGIGWAIEKLSEDDEL